MAKDIEQELDAIFAHHKARVAAARSDSAGNAAVAEDFSPAATACMAGVIAPALEHMAHALRERGVAAKVVSGGNDVRIDVPVSRHVRLGQGHGGYPYLRARPDYQTCRIHFERNTSDSRGGSAIGDFAISEVNAPMVHAMVVEFVRALYGPF
ncbi:MAG: hypothetical protein JSR36_02500 [Proteobacteria bacterium]|nr:hypothetical protein [Pseudomonadota bacterium]